MTTNFLTRPRTVHDQQIREPTLLALVLAVLGFLVLLITCLVGMASLPAFGYRGWTFAGVAAIAAWLLLGRRRKPKPGLLSPTSRQQSLRRIRVLGRWLL